MGINPKPRATIRNFEELRHMPHVIVIINQQDDSIPPLLPV